MHGMGGGKFGDFAVLDTPVLSLEIGGKSTNVTILVDSQNVERIDFAVILHFVRNDADECCGAARVCDGSSRRGDDGCTRAVSNLFHETLDLAFRLCRRSIGLSFHG